MPVKTNSKNKNDFGAPEIQLLKHIKIQLPKEMHSQDLKYTKKVTEGEVTDTPDIFCFQKVSHLCQGIGRCQDRHNDKTFQQVKYCHSRVLYVVF